jgi:outer membrane protein TolC
MVLSTLLLSNVMKRMGNPHRVKSQSRSQGDPLKRLVIMTGCALLAACAHYEPRVLDLRAFPTVHDTRPLEKVQATDVWTETDLLAQALKTSPAILASESSARLALASAQAAKVHPAASLNLTAEYSKAAGGSSPWLYGAALDLPFDQGQRRDSRVQSADLAALQALYAYGEAVWTGYSTIRHALIDRSFADQALSPSADLVAARTILVTLTERRVDQGEEARPMVFRAKADLAVAQTRQRDAVRKHAQSEEALAQALGMTSDKITGLRLAVEAADVSIDPSQLKIWRRDAVLFRQDVLSAVAAYDRADLDLRLAYAKQYPEVRLGPGYVWERGVDKLPLTVGLSLPPYDLNRAAIAEANERRIEAGRLLDNSQAAVLAAVDQAFTALEQARANRDQADQIDQPLTLRSLDMAQLTALAGETDGLDLAIAKASAAEATLSAIEARHTASLAQADLEDALRRPFNPQDRQALQAAIDHLKAQR